MAEPLAGSAARARAWVVIEQPGPWGRQAVTDSHLDRELGAALQAAAAGHDTRVALIRRPGRHADRPGGSPARQVYLANTLPGRGWLLGGRFTDPADLLAVPWQALAEGAAGAVSEALPTLQPVSEPVLLICTNGRRDRCCAILGRPIAAGLHEELGGHVWETTHTGGHRFAPTSVLLPYGLMHGRLDARLARAVVSDARAGHVCLTGYRGRSTYGRASQAAEAAVRVTTGETGLHDLTVADVVAAGDQIQVTVAHLDGRGWRVDVTRRILTPPRPESCGKPAVTPESYTVRAISPVNRESSATTAE